MTTCRACGRDNKPGRKFCAFCGAAMASGCPACGTPYDAGELFCGECGTALPQGPAGSSATVPPPLPAATPVAERRLVSVLFADLVGFTPFAEQRDAEEVRETLGRYFEIASDVVARYGGTIEKFIGDAVMAVWGTPRAHEDDAERAVRASLDLVDAVRVLGPGIQARAGVLTGEAAVTIGATNQGMVAGDLVNTAARLQGVALPGTVLAGEATMRAASKAIAFDAVGEQALKGKVATVPAWRALRVVAEVGGRNRQEGLEAPFVGRDDEMRQLRDLFHATAKDRRVRLISVLGPAGIGKSRFAWEFLKYVDGLAYTVWWHQGRSPAYGSGLAYWALGEMVRGRCGLLESDDEATTRLRVAATVAEHVPDAEERAWIEPAVLALLGVGDRAAASDQLFAAWRTFFERLAVSAPVVMVFEDLHWADTGTLDFIDHLLDWTRDQPITIITLARPELLERRPGWGGGRRHFLALTLDPLSAPAMRELLAGLVPGLPERAVGAIVARADGVPLYAVETVRSLLADGRLRSVDGRYEPVGDLSELAVPDSLTALIASRLDALDAQDRSLLQDAAVLGQSFTPAALAAVSGGDEETLGPRLRALVRRELLSVEMDPRSPERGQYTFVQALIREVAYNTLAKRDRRAKHLAAARWFESIGSDELAGALARHYLAAWENTPEGPEADALAAQARVALRGAAERSIALDANEQAVDLLREALTVTTDPVERGALLELAGMALDVIGRYQDAEAFGREAMALAEATKDDTALARAAGIVARGLAGQWRTSEAVELNLEVLRRVEHLGPHPDVLDLRRRYANSVRRAGRTREAFGLADEVLEAAEHAGHRIIAIQTIWMRGGICCDLGRTLEGLALLEGARRLAEVAGRQDLALWVTGDQVIYQIATDPGAAYRLGRTLVESSRRLRRRSDLALNTLNASEVAVRVGDWDWALAAMRELLPDDLESTDRIILLENLTQIKAFRGEGVTELLDEAHALVGDIEERRPMLDDRLAAIAWVEGRYDEAASTWRRFCEWSTLNRPMILPKAARAMLWKGDAAAARRDLAALDATGVHGAATDNARTLIQAGIDALEGRRAEARASFRTAIVTWRDLGLAWDEALACLDHVLLLGADDPDAPTAADRARELFERLGARPFLAKLDAAMAVSGPVTA